MDNDYKVELLKDAYEKIREAIELIESAVRDTNVEAYADKYTLSTLYGIIGEGNPYDFNKISNLIEDLTTEEEETPEDYEVFLRRM